MSASPVQPAPVQQNHAAPEFDREFDLLLALCADHAEEERIRAISRDPFDWQRFVEIAEYHGLIPRIGESIPVLSGILPVDTARSIQQLYEANTRRALWLSRELIRVLKHLESQEIFSLPYKGPALAELLYGNVAARQFSDLDILVHARDVARTRTALGEIGFTPGIALTQPEERAFLQTGYELTFDSSNGRNLLEIQWQILPRFYMIDFDMEALFRRGITQSIAGVTIRALRAEDLLLVLCVHAAKHLWMQLSWLCDIAALVKKTRLDWEFVWRECQTLGIRRIVEVTFTLAHCLLGAAVPLARQTDDGTDGLVSELIPQIARSAPFDPESLDYFRLFAKTRERPADRARFWWRLVTTPSSGEWSAVQLPDALFPLYRAVRAARLLKRVL